jgi:3-phenylpropionate/trans-cinnamate dioxygenase ferredoxin reductase subunit
MSSLKRVVIVGAGLAGATAARTLREEGFDGHLVLVGAERHPPYERPPLSKDYLRGESQQVAAYVEPERYWVEHDVELRSGLTVSQVDLANGRVELADSASLGFDRLLLAPGAEPRTLAIPGSDLAGVVTLRSFADADHIRELAREAGRVLVVGGGWIAAEVAASLRVLGREVTWALRGRRALEGALGPEVAEVYQGLHDEHGVTVLPGTEIVALDGSDVVRRARTASGDWLDADLVVVAIGVMPRTELLRSAGWAIADGIAVDGRLATSDPRVFAADDAALVPHPVLGDSLRVEHWGAALAQGEHAGRAMLGDARPYDHLPYYFSDQYETGLEFWGDPARRGDMVVRGDLDARSFTAFWHDAGKVNAVLNMHVHHHDHAHDGAAGHTDDHTDHHHAESGGTHAGGHVDSAVVEQLIRNDAPVKIDALQDPDLPLETLAPLAGPGAAHAQHTR